MSLKLVDLSIRGFERVVHATDSTTKLDCLIAIHNTKLGPALGGVRSWSYDNFEAQRDIVSELLTKSGLTLNNKIHSEMVESSNEFNSIFNQIWSRVE